MARQVFSQWVPVAKAQNEQGQEVYLPFAGIHAQTRDGKDEVIVGAGNMVWTGSMWVPVSDQNRLPVEATLSGHIPPPTVERIVYGPDNMLPGTTSGFWAPRDTNFREAILPHGSLGIVDQAIHIRHTLDATLTVQLRIRTVFADGQGQYGTIIWADTAIPSDARWTLVPEKGTGHVEPLSGVQKVFAVPELRSPIYEFVLAVAANTAPTTGTISITVERRF